MKDRDFDWGASYKPPTGGPEWTAQTGNGNGYAKIREVYQLLRESEERIDVRLREMEARITHAIEKIGEREEERWLRHDEESQDIRSQLKNIEQTEIISTAYQTAAHDAEIKRLPAPEIVKKHVRLFGSVVDYAEKHWRIIMFVLLVLSLIVGLTDLSELFR